MSVEECIALPPFSGSSWASIVHHKHAFIHRVHYGVPSANLSPNYRDISNNLENEMRNLVVFANYKPNLAHLWDMCCRCCNHIVPVFLFHIVLFYTSCLKFSFGTIEYIWCSFTKTKLHLLFIKNIAPRPNWLLQVYKSNTRNWSK